MAEPADPFDPFTMRYRIHDTPVDSKPSEPKSMDAPDQKSDTPQLEIAATILTGLLASGDYTEDAERFEVYTGDKPPARARYRPEAVNDAVELAVKLSAAVRLMTPQGP